MFTMPLSPLIVNKTSGDWMWTAASVLSLHGSSRLQFDPSLDIDFDGESDDVKQSGLSMLERYVSKLLEASFEDSSLFWHYALRHVPSPSLVCADRDHSSKRDPDGSNFVRFEDDANISAPANAPNVWDFIPGNSSIPAYGYAAFPLGAAGSECFCGWARGPPDHPTWCQIPEAICRDMDFPVCTYDPSTEGGDIAIALIMDAWPSKAPAAAPGREWTCPHMDLSDSWGIMSAKDTQEWILRGNAKVQLSELLRSGNLDALCVDTLVKVVTLQNFEQGAPGCAWAASRPCAGTRRRMAESGPPSAWRRCFRQMTRSPPALDSTGDHTLMCLQKSGTVLKS